MKKLVSFVTPPQPYSGSMEKEVTYVNPDYVVRLERSDNDTTLIHLTRGSVRVEDRMSLVASKLEEATR